jgi:hypothetical protein
VVFIGVLYQLFWFNCVFFTRGNLVEESHRSSAFLPRWIRPRKIKSTGLRWKLKIPWAVSARVSGNVCWAAHRVEGRVSGSGDDKLISGRFIDSACRATQCERGCDGGSQAKSSGLRNAPSGSNAPNRPGCVLRDGGLVSGVCSSGLPGTWQRQTISHDYTTVLALRRALGPGSPARQGAWNE